MSHFDMRDQALAYPAQVQRLRRRREGVKFYKNEVGKRETKCGGVKRSRETRNVHFGKTISWIFPGFSWIFERNDTVEYKEMMIHRSGGKCKEVEGEAKSGN